MTSGGAYPPRVDEREGASGSTVPPLFPTPQMRHLDTWAAENQRAGARSPGVDVLHLEGIRSDGVELGVDLRGGWCVRSFLASDQDGRAYVLMTAGPVVDCHYDYALVIPADLARTVLAGMLDDCEPGDVLLHPLGAGDDWALRVDEADGRLWVSIGAGQGPHAAFTLPLPPGAAPRLAEMLRELTSWREMRIEREALLERRALLDLAAGAR